MKTTEELKGMTTEDLARYATELQESLEEEKKKSDLWYRKYEESRNRLSTFRDAVKSVVILVEE